MEQPRYFLNAEPARQPTTSSIRDRYRAKYSIRNQPTAAFQELSLSHQPVDGGGPWGSHPRISEQTHSSMSPNRTTGNKYVTSDKVNMIHMSLQKGVPGKVSKANPLLYQPPTVNYQQQPNEYPRSRISFEWIGSIIASIGAVAKGRKKSSKNGTNGSYAESYESRRSSINSNDSSQFSQNLEILGLKSFRAKATSFRNTVSSIKEVTGIKANSFRNKMTLKSKRNDIPQPEPLQRNKVPTATSNPNDRPSTLQRNMKRMMGGLYARETDPADHNMIRKTVEASTPKKSRKLRSNRKPQEEERPKSSYQDFLQNTRGRLKKTRPAKPTPPKGMQEMTKETKKEILNPSKEMRKESKKEIVKPAAVISNREQSMRMEEEVKKLDKNQKLTQLTLILEKPSLEAAFQKFAGSKTNAYLFCKSVKQFSSFHYRTSNEQLQDLLSTEEVFTGKSESSNVGQVAILSDAFKIYETFLQDGARCKVNFKSGDILKKITHRLFVRPETVDVLVFKKAEHYILKQLAHLYLDPFVKECIADPALNIDIERSIKISQDPLNLDLLETRLDRINAKIARLAEAN